MRARMDLEREHAAAVAELGKTMDGRISRLPTGFASGVADALEWVLGFGDVAPITLAPIPQPRHAEIVAEHAAAKAVVNGQVATHGRNWGWMTGVEQALSWTTEAGAPAPI
jgi:hypothetical protein